jgi:hypothetical protein
MTERRRVHLHRDNEATEERQNGIAVKCPFCGEWEDSHTLMHDGCDCGAEAWTELTFEKDENNK